MELQSTLEIGIIVLVFGYFTYKDSKINKKLLRIKKAQLSLQIHKQAWFMSLSEYMNKQSLTDELNDAQDLLIKAIKEEKYEDAALIQKDINKYLEKLNKRKK